MKPALLIIGSFWSGYVIAMICLKLFRWREKYDGHSLPRLRRDPPTAQENERWVARILKARETSRGPFQDEESS